MVQGVALRQLAVDLVSDGVPAPAVKAVVQVQGLSRMVEVAMSRSRQVRSPQRYCRAVLAREWEQLVSQCAPAAYPLCARHRVRLSPAGQCRECVQESREAAEDGFAFSWREYASGASARSGARVEFGKYSKS